MNKMLNMSKDIYTNIVDAFVKEDIKTLKKAYKFSMAGGSSLLKINRRSSDMALYVSAHRIDTFFVDVTPSGEIKRARIFQRLLSSTVSETLETKQYMLVEEIFKCF